MNCMEISDILTVTERLKVIISRICGRVEEINLSSLEEVEKYDTWKGSVDLKYIRCYVDIEKYNINVKFYGKYTEDLHGELTINIVKHIKNVKINEFSWKYNELVFTKKEMNRVFNAQSVINKIEKFEREIINKSDVVL